MRYIKLFEDVWEELNFRKLSNDVKYFLTDLKDDGFKIMTFENERDILDEYDYIISIYFNNTFKVEFLKDNLDTIMDYINEFYSYDSVNYKIAHTPIWPNTETGFETIDDYNLKLNSDINRIDIEFENIKKL